MSDSSTDPNDQRLDSAADEPDPYALASDAAYQNLSLMPPMFVPLFYLPMAVATIPGEVRMYARILKRGRPNLSEIVFLVLKYLYLVHAICFSVVMWGGPGYVTAASCFNMWWFSKWAMYTAATLVTLACALRAYVILGRRRSLGITLLSALFIQYGMGMGLAATDVNMDNYWGGYCFSSSAVTGNLILLTVYLGYSCVFDLAMVVPSVVSLVRSSTGIRSMHKTTKMLFEHSIHYVFAVTLINLFQLIFGQTHQDIENFTVAAITAQVVLALFQIITEQDSVNGYIGFRGEDLYRTPRIGFQSSQVISSGAGSSKFKCIFRSASRRPTTTDEESPACNSGKRSRDLGSFAKMGGSSGQLSIPLVGTRRGSKSAGTTSEQGQPGDYSVDGAADGAGTVGLSQLSYEKRNNP